MIIDNSVNDYANDSNNNNSNNQVNAKDFEPINPTLLAQMGKEIELQSGRSGRVGI